MKKALLAAGAASLLLFSGRALGAALMANSAHDLSSGSTADTHDDTTGTATTTRICVFCHTPHGATVGAAPLWNKNVAAGGTYTMYSSATITGAMATDPTAASLSCLACHDGTTSSLDTMNNLEGAAVAAGDISFTDPAPANLDANNYLVSGNAALDQDLSNDHPVGVSADGSDTGIAAAGVIIAAGLPLYGLVPDKVECGTCHTSHDDTIPFFLRITTANSLLCVTCHTNK